ncbi:helix-turn-helix transcriptional regulator [Lysinibacillus sp. FSL M8-0216]|uniref:helix-turn-helix transcriptional regulator n=1 Tax=Lysinibacillus TaxID=400634 RepID=UPI0000F3A918|nr:helix-turn-helix transcriptional regulator [Lysinibacillus fusiformis]EAZ85000.1 molybdenum-binding protein [Bacillus sp. B14905]HAU34309.1 helix-turn-helix domain-containing protein [Lysinibacillus sp.]MCG7436382.1 helix-turn-helix transcriptional regulator [Lysinibacillus fusiformis]MED4075006.1 helix-turn-helix transcriptional regulator [Lysinibacillus fusiformis]NOG26806.1 helix-turn-helix transcriptional regulator [Lysinibacillus fusiformis]
MSQEQSYTIEEVAQLLKVSKLTVYDLVKKGDLPVFRVGRQMRVDRADLQGYIQKRKTGNAASTPVVARQTKKLPKMIISGQDVVLDVLAKYMEKRQSSKVLRSHEGSFNGIMAMYNGECDIASLHMFDGDTGDYNTPYVKKIFVSHPFLLINVVSRRAGFYVQQGNPLQLESFKDFKTKSFTLINREKGSGARTLLDEQLRIHHIAPSMIDGYDKEEMSHLDVASAVANGHADVGIGVEKIAKLVNVDFIPVIRERYDIVLLKTPDNQQLIDTVKEILTSADFQSEVAALGDYDVSQMGQVIYETL